MSSTPSPLARSLVGPVGNYRKLEIMDPGQYTEPQIAALLQEKGFDLRYPYTKTDGENGGFLYEQDLGQVQGLDAS